MLQKKTTPCGSSFFGLRDRLSTCNQSVNKEVKGQAVRTYPSLADAQRCVRFGMRQTRYFSKSSASQYATASESDWQEITLLQGSDSRAGQKTELRGQRSEYDKAGLNKVCSCIIFPDVRRYTYFGNAPPPRRGGGRGRGNRRNASRSSDARSVRRRRTPY